MLLQNIGRVLHEAAGAGCLLLSAVENFYEVLPHRWFDIFKRQTYKKGDIVCVKMKEARKIRKLERKREKKEKPI